MKKTTWISATVLFSFCMALPTIAQEPTKKQSSPHQPYLFSELGVSLFNSLPNGQYDKPLLGAGANVFHRFSKADRRVKFSAGLEYRYLHNYIDYIKADIASRNYITRTEVHYYSHSISFPFRIEVMIDKKGRFSADIRGYAHVHLILVEKGLRSGGVSHHLKNEPYRTTYGNPDGHLGGYIGLNYRFSCAERKYVARLAFERTTLDKIYEDKKLVGNYIMVGISYVFR